jgi:NADP-dependent aldehyde dehydrogenase
MLVARRGVAIVFGASNFPLAYGVCGGDTASAIAAGLPVVVKEHPGHRETGRRIARVAREAIGTRGISSDVLGYVEEAASEGEFEVARALVLHERAAAVGFTGSFAGGMAIEKLARSRERGPIPVFAEMGSTNPVFVTRAALEKRGGVIAEELGASLLMRHGQQCTCPGLVVIESEVLLAPVEAARGVRDEVADEFEALLARLVASAPARRMLTQRVREGFVRQTNRIASYMPEVERLALGETGEAGDARVASAMLFRVDIDELRKQRVLSEEAFGPSTIVSRFSTSRMDMVEELLETMQGQLVACVYAEPQELSDASSPSRKLLTCLMDAAGRVVVNCVPTGVRVCEAMVHSGPFPASNAPETTAVGMRAIERWCRPVCLQNWPAEALPDGLRG